MIPKCMRVQAAARLDTAAGGHPHEDGVPGGQRHAGQGADSDGDISKGVAIRQAACPGAARAHAEGLPGGRCSGEQLFVGLATRA